VATQREVDESKPEDLERGEGGCENAGRRMVDGCADLKKIGMTGAETSEWQIDEK
jgi:hypothetical protein